ncbi:cache domain-containing protein [Roseateles sp. GG27B]
MKQFSCSAQQLGRPSFLILLTLALIGLGLALGQRWSERAGMAQLAAVAAERLELYAATLEAELARHAYLPSLISIDTDVLALLQAPGNNATPPSDQRQLRQRAALKLARINVRAGASMTFVTDAQGQVLASSADYRTPGQDREATQVARRLSRNLIEASVQTTGHFFAANEANGSTDYFLVQKVARAGQRLGLIVVKLNLAPLEATWVDQGLRSQGEKLMVLDDHDVVIMSSVHLEVSFLDAGSDQHPRCKPRRYIAPLLLSGR